jgi:hypothetical protein
MLIRKAFSFVLFLALALLPPAVSGTASQAAHPRREPPAGKVRGPWSDARVGTRVDQKSVEPNYIQDIVTLKTLEVVAADDESVTVKASGSVNGKKKNDQKMTLPRFAPPAELKKLLDNFGRKTGQKKLWIKDKEVLCDQYERREKHPTMDVEGTRTTFISEDVPSWIVRIEDRNEGEGRLIHSMPHDTLDFTWGPEEKPAPTAVPAELPIVPATPANRALAAELMARVVKTYFSMLETDASAFDAVYTVKKGGTAVGSARSTWNSEAGRTETKISGSLGEEEADWLSTLVTLGLLQSVFTEGDNEKLFAMKVGDGYVFTDDSAVNDAVKSRQTLLSADLAQTGEVLKLANGVVRRIVRKAEKGGDRLFVTSARILIGAPGEAGRTAEYGFTFDARGGLPFVETMTISDTGLDGRTRVWVLRLDTIRFSRPGKRP